MTLVEPGLGGGLVEVFRRRYLLRLLVRRELRARYKGSLLGLGWSYVRPTVSFAVYFFVVGVFLQMSDLIEDFPVHLFAGMVLINFFVDTVHAATRSVTGNAALVRKVYLPRELFPSASLLVSCVHLLPGLLILTAGAALAGWSFSPAAPAAALLGFAIVALLAAGLGLFCAAVNVFLRDTEQVVDILTIVVTWSVPMIYSWVQVRDHAPAWVLDVYLANPLVPAVALFQRAFWEPGVTGPVEALPGLWERGLVALAVAAAVCAFGQWTFARLQRRFVEEL
ncbi:ABC transporter permease [Actinomadura craniellae]|nr:ABC transporter permease [Actinomadura craniellae]